MSDDTMSAVFDLMEPQGIITNDVLLALDQLFGERLISEFAAFDVRTLATEISVRRSALVALIPQTITSIDLAKELLDILRKLEYIDAPAPTAGPAKAAPAPEQEERSRDDDWYREQLEAVASLDRHAMSNDLTIVHEVVRTARTMSGNIDLNGAIVLGQLSTMSGNVFGEAYFAPHADVSSMSGNVSVRAKRLSWPDLYKKAVKLGIIET